MIRIMHTAVLAAFTVFATSLVAIAAAVENPPAAPIPAQILSANKVFIANGGSAVESADSITPNLPYDEFYAGMKSWAHFELLPGPAEADLVMEIRYVTVLPTIIGKNGARTRRQVELLFIDPKTRLTLWTIYEQFDGAIFDSNKRKDLDAGMKALLDDVKDLTKQPPAGTASASSR